MLPPNEGCIASDAKPDFNHFCGEAQDYSFAYGGG